MGRLKGGRPKILGVARCAPQRLLELSAVPIRGLLLADVLADLLQLESDGGHRVAASPEVLSGEVPLLAAKPGNSTLALQKPDHRRDWVLGWNRDSHVHVIWHQVPLNDLTLFLLGQRMELDLPPFLTQPVKTQNPSKGELSHGIVEKDVHQRVQAGRGPATGARELDRRGGAGAGGKPERAAPLAA